MWARGGDCCGLSLCVGGEFASKHGPSCGLFGSFLASVIGLVFHMLFGHPVTIFCRAGKLSHTWSNSWAELASPKLVFYEFSESQPKFCLSWLRLFISVWHSSLWCLLHCPMVGRLGFTSQLLLMSSVSISHPMEVRVVSVTLVSDLRFPVHITLPLLCIGQFILLRNILDIQ